MRLLEHEGKIMLKRMVDDVEIELEVVNAQMLFEIEQYLNDEVTREIFRRWKFGFRAHL